MDDPTYPRSYPFLQHGGFYRGVDDLSVPWQPSPVLPHNTQFNELGLDGEEAVFDVSPSFTIRDRESKYLVVVDKPPLPLPSSPSIEGEEGEGRGRRRGKRVMRRIGGWLRCSTCFRGPSTLTEVEDIIEREEEIPPDIVKPYEWKAYAYYARPRVNDVTVQNTPILSTPPQIPLSTLFPLLKSPNGTKHPERWIPGLTHPSLPPPTRWVPPKPGEPLPFPWECQLNPLLHHLRTGAAPLYWDLKIDPSYGVLFNRGTRHDTSVPISPSDKIQPATYPFVTHLYINALSEDPHPKFPWPSMITNPSGVRVGDVLDTIYANFQQYVKDYEYASWHSVRREQAYEAYVKRGRRGEGLRRVDYLGQMSLFRGLEANPNGEGWILFVGMA